MIFLCFFQVVENAPYVTTLETLDEYSCDFCVHGGILITFIMFWQQWMNNQNRDTDNDNNDDNKDNNDKGDDNDKDNNDGDW